MLCTLFQTSKYSNILREVLKQIYQSLENVQTGGSSYCGKGKKPNSYSDSYKLLKNTITDCLMYNLLILCCTQLKILCTRCSGHSVPFLLAPAEGWVPFGPPATPPPTPSTPIWPKKVTSMPYYKCVHVFCLNYLKA